MQTSEERDPPPLTWYDAFLAESQRLDPSFAVPGDIGDIGARSDPSTRLSRLARLNRAAFDGGRTALCLSGGGIRSASFAVGVLQALAQRGLIRGFDYLSTVSGGGFAGAWLSTWLHRAGAGDAGTPPEQAHAALRFFEGAAGSPGSPGSPGSAGAAAARRGVGGRAATTS